MPEPAADVVLDHHRIAEHRGRAPHDRAEVGAVDDQAHQLAMDARGALEARVGARHETLVDGLRDLDERHLARQLEHGQVDLVGLAAHDVGDRLEVVAALHDHRDRPGVDHPTGQRPLERRVVAQVVRGREQEVARGQVVGEVVDIHPLHPLDLAPEPAADRSSARPSAVS